MNVCELLFRGVDLSTAQIYLQERTTCGTVCSVVLQLIRTVSLQ